MNNIISFDNFTTPIRDIIEGILNGYMFELMNDETVNEIKKAIEMTLSQLDIASFRVEINISPEEHLTGKVYYQIDEKVTDFRVVEFTVLNTGTKFNNLDEEKN